MKFFLSIVAISALLSVSPALSKDHHHHHHHKHIDCPHAHPHIPVLAYKNFKNHLSSGAKILFPGSAEYLLENTRWAINSELPAKAIIQVATAEDVAKSLTFIKRYNSEFAVLSGGHNMNKAAASTGIVIDMHLLNHTTYHSKSKTVSVGAGVRWGALDDYLTPHKVCIVGGRVSDVGVAGFLTGGGYSWKSGQFGLGADNIVSAEVVLANGKIVHASKKSHPDLFFGIRGGGSQFGIVTKFVLKTHPQPNLVWTGFLFFTAGQIDDVAAALEKFAAHNNDPKANALLFLANPNGVPTPILVPWYDGPVSVAKPKFKVFYDLNPVVDTTKDMTFADGNKAQDGVVPPGGRNLLEGVTLSEIKASKITKAWKLFTKFLVANPDAGMSAILFEPAFHGAFAGIKNSDTAWPHGAKKAFAIAGFNSRWSMAKNDHALFKTTKHIGALLRKGEKKSLPQYPNYVLFNTPLHKMFQGNLHRLNHLKKELDPTCLFKNGFVFDTPACRKCVKVF